MKKRSSAFRVAQHGTSLVYGRCGGKMMLPVPLDFRAVLQECMRNGARHAILSQIFNRTAGEVLQPAHQLLKQGNELMQ